MNNTTSLRRRALIYTAIAMALTLLSVALRLLSLTLCYDASIGYFPAGAILPMLSEGLVLASVVAFVVPAFLWFRKKDTAYATKPNLAVKITAGLCAILALLLGILDLKAGNSVAGLLLCFGACLYFLLVLTGKTTPILALVFGFCAILRLLSELANSYVDFYVPMNSPEKVWLYVGIVAAMFFLVSELRALVTRPYTAIYFFSAASATLVASSSAIALITGQTASLFYGRYTLGNTLHAILLLAVAIYAGARLVTVALNPKPIEEAEPLQETQETQAPEEPEEPQAPEEPQGNDQE